MLFSYYLNLEKRVIKDPLFLQKLKNFQILVQKIIEEYVNIKKIPKPTSILMGGKFWEKHKKITYLKGEYGSKKKR